MIFPAGVHVPIAQSPTILTAVLLVLVSYAGPADSETQVQLSAADLVKAVIRNETNTTSTTEIRWNYRSDKEVDGKQETREVVETKSGSLDRLIATGGKPLNDSQQRNETERILRLSHDPEEQRKLEQGRQKDAQQCNAFLRLIPDAFLFEYAGESGELMKVKFRPNPSFQPPSREGRVLHEMAGEIWVNTRQQRLVSINGQLMNDVKFGGGWLGHLEKGGQFAVKRTQIAPNHWELTEMMVNMRGKALLFKTISVQQKEVRTSFQPVRADLSLSDAAGLLLNEALVAALR